MPSLNSVPLGTFWILLAACIGGIFVLLGLALEKTAEKYDKREKWDTKTESLVKWKHWKATAGWWILMLGIAIEIADAGLTANEINNDNPLKQPIANASATVRFLVKIKSYAVPFFPIEPDDIVGWKSQIMFFSGTNMSDNVLQLTALQNDAVVFDRGLPPQRAYQLQFHTDPLIDFSNTSGNKSRPAEILNNVASFILAMPQLETNAEILSGSVVLVANGKTWTFEIPPQRQKWGIITSKRILNAKKKPETKVMPIQVGDLMIPPRWTNRWYDGK